MNNGELKEYLNGFPDDASLSVILVNPKKRKLYEINKIYIGSDFGHPAFLLMWEKNLIWTRKWSRLAKRTRMWQDRWRLRTSRRCCRD